MNVRKASTIVAKPVEYVWLDRIPSGMITVVSGRAGEGKSTFLRMVVADVSQRAPVIYSNQEDNHGETIKPSLEAHGAVLKRVFVPDEPYVLPDDVDRLERKVKQIGAKLIVLDSALQHLGPSTASGQGVRKALTPLRAMLERTGCACVFVDHLIKRPKATSHPLEALTGSGSGLPAAARFVYVFGTNPKTPEERILAPVKVNVAKVESSVSFEFESKEVNLASPAERKKTGRLLCEVGMISVISNESVVEAADVLSWNGKGSKVAGDSPSKKAIAAEWLTGFLMFGARKAGDVEADGEQAGFSWATLRRASTSMAVAKERKGYGKDGAWFWRLPDGHVALAMASTMQAAGVAPSASDDEEEEA